MSAGAAELLQAALEVLSLQTAAIQRRCLLCIPQEGVLANRRKDAMGRYTMAYLTLVANQNGSTNGTFKKHTPPFLPLRAISQTRTPKTGETPGSTAPPRLEGRQLLGRRLRKLGAGKGLRLRALDHRQGLLLALGHSNCFVQPM